jgi:hypothetical protein
VGGSLCGAFKKTMPACDPPPPRAPTTCSENVLAPRHTLTVLCPTRLIQHSGCCSVAVLPASGRTSPNANGTPAAAAATQTNSSGASCATPSITNHLPQQQQQQHAKGATIHAQVSQVVPALEDGGPDQNWAACFSMCTGQSVHKSAPTDFILFTILTRTPDHGFNHGFKCTVPSHTPPPPVTAGTHYNEGHLVADAQGYAMFSTVGEVICDGSSKRCISPTVSRTMW